MKHPSNDPPHSPYPYPDAVRPDVLRLIPKDGTVLGSIGCGAAASEAVLVTNGRIVHGVDASAEAIEVARTRLTTARVIDPNDRTPFADNSLDGLILADVLEHLPLAAMALRSFTQSVRIGGWVVISVPNMLYIQVLYHMLCRRDWPERSTGIFDQTHVQFMTRRRLKRWCDDSGLRIEEWSRRYDPNGPRRERTSRLLDIVSFGLLRDYCAYEIQVRCRRIN